MAIVTLAYPASAFPEPLTGSGYLVPAVDDRAVKAATFSTVKWPHLHTGDLHVVRCSVGRIGEEAVLQRDDSDLVALAAADFAAATGVTGAPVDSLVTRWAAACLSTRSVTWTGSPRSGLGSAGWAAWRSAAPPTMASESPRASPPRG